MYSIEYQLTHDIDYFFIQDFGDEAKPIHIASNGGVMPDRLGSMAFIQNCQKQAFALPMQFDYVLNMDYLNQLKAEEFPSTEEIAESGFMNTDHYTQFDNLNLSHHTKLYAYSFVEMARRGFWSFDRLTDGSGEDMLNSEGRANVYQLVASPKFSEHDRINYPRIGYVFRNGSVTSYRYKNRWDFALWLSTAKRLR